MEIEDLVVIERSSLLKKQCWHDILNFFPLHYFLDFLQKKDLFITILFHQLDPKLVYETTDDVGYL
jgi:hypothetical protein